MNIFTLILLRSASVTLETSVSVFSKVFCYVKVQFSHLTVKLVSHKCHLWFGWRWCNGYICLSGKWEVENDGREVC